MPPVPKKKLNILTVIFPGSKVDEPHSIINGKKRYWKEHNKIAEARAWALDNGYDDFEVDYPNLLKEEVCHQSLRKPG